MKTKNISDPTWNHILERDKAINQLINAIKSHIVQLKSWAGCSQKYWSTYQVQ